MAIGCGDNVSPAPRGGDSDAGCSANSLDSGFDEIQIGNGDVAAAMWTPYANTPSPNDDAANASVVDATTEEGTAPTTTNSNIEH